MKLEIVGISQPENHGRFQTRLKFAPQTYCVVEVPIGEEASDIAKKLRDLAGHVEARNK